MIKHLTLFIQNLVFIAFKNIKIPNQNQSADEWNQSKMNIFNRTENYFFFKAIKFRNHPITIGKNPANDSVVVVPFRSVIPEMFGHINGQK